MITVSQLQNVSISDFQLASITLQAAANGALDSLNTVTTARGQLASWKGPASQAATTALGQVTRPLSQGAEILDSIPATVDGFVTAVQEAQARLQVALIGLGCLNFQGQGFPCDDSGNVTFPPPPAAPPASWTPLLMMPPAQAQAVQQQNIAANLAQAAYQNVRSQARGYQTTIHQALTDATSADGRAAGVLTGPTNDGGDLVVVLGGGPGAAADMAMLSADAAPINAADVKGAQALIAKAKGGDQQAADALAQGPFAELAKDPLFATSLLNTLGDKHNSSAKGLLNISYGMSHNLNENTDPVLQFLSRVLATGTSGVAEGVAAAGTAYTVGSDYLTALKKAGRAADTRDEPGYWGLGQILGAATTPYSTGFMTNVGQDVINWSHQHGGDGSNAVGPNEGLMTGMDSDPVVGLMRALAVNGPGGSGAPGAQALLDPHGPIPIADQPPGGNLQYLITKHNWKDDPGSYYFGDNGASLGQAIQSAGMYGSSGTQNLADLKPGRDPSIDVTTAAVNDYGHLLQVKQGNVPTLVGLQQPMAYLLSHHYNLVQAAAASTDDPGGPIRQYMGAVIAQIANDPQGAAALRYTAQVAAAQAPPGRTMAEPAIESLGYVAQGLQVGLQTAGANADSLRNAQSVYLNRLGFAVLGTASAGASLAAPEAAPLIGLASPTVNQIWNTVSTTTTHSAEISASATASSMDGDLRNWMRDHQVDATNGFELGSGTAYYDLALLTRN